MFVKLASSKLTSEGSLFLVRMYDLPTDESEILKSLFFSSPLVLAL